MSIFPLDISNDLLYRLRSLIDTGHDDSMIQILDKNNRVLIELLLKWPCAPDPRDGVMALYEPQAALRPKNSGKAVKAQVINGDERVILLLEVGKKGSKKPVELEVLDISASTVVKASTRLILNW